MNHEERVLAKIALVAACFADGVDKGTGIIKAAELAVKWEAEAYENAFNICNWDSDQCFDFLIKHGLIPPQTQTT